MTLRICKQCGGHKPLTAYHANGSGRHRAVCKQCVRKTKDLTSEKARAIAMWHDGKRLREIARAVARDDRTVSYWLNSAGIQTRERSKANLDGTHRGDPASGEPIGDAGSKFAEVDAAILRAYREAGLIKRGDKWVPGPRRGSPSANPWPAQSSLA